MSQPGQPRRRRPSKGFLLTLYGIVAVETIALIVLIVLLVQSGASAGAGEPDAGGASAPSPTQTPESAAEQLLASADDPAACAVSFAGDVQEEPVLETQGQLFAHLPVPVREGAVFAGWYSDEEAAAEYAIDRRVSGSDMVECEDQQLTLHPAWKTPDEVAAEDTGVPILMYHQFTDKPEGEDHWLRLNYAYAGEFDAHIAYIAENGFYLPTWSELSAFIDGELWLPQKSVIVTDDDAHPTWFEFGVPVIEKYQVMATSFVITAARTEPSPSPWILQRSHTHEMHEAGANGDGRMVNWSLEEQVADLNTSGDILGAREVVCYPFGDYNETSKQAVADAGYEMAVTIEGGEVHAGADKLALPRVRIDYGMTVEDVAALIG